MPRRFAVLLGAVLVTLSSAAPAGAAAPSPPFTQCPAVGADTSCALLIYIDSAGATGVAGDPSQGPYDSIEDTLIGVQNNSSFSIGRIPVSATSGKDLFGFDGDGLCVYGISGCPFGPSGYEGPGVSFTNISADLTSGTVNFSPAIPPGGSAYFSLEEALATAPPYDIVSGPPNTGGGLNYVALGDSFSSGEGNPSFETGTDTSSDKCHRSVAAYPEGLASDTGLNITSLTFRACSGARRRDIVVGSNTEDGQLDHITKSTNLVTISVGGNDAEFADVLKGCITGAGASLAHTHGSADCQHSPATDPNSGNKTTLDGRENVLIDDLGRDTLCATPSGYVTCVPRLASLYYDISQRAAPNARIFVLLYPHLFTTTPDNGGCSVGSTGKVSKQNVSWLNAGVDKVDAKIVSEINVARSAGVNVTAVDPRSTYDNGGASSPGGHGVCTAQSWINGLKLDGLGASPFSFHPNATGQFAFSLAMRAKITSS